MAEDLVMILAAGIQADKKQATNMNEKQHIATYISTCKRQQYRSNSQGQAVVGSKSSFSLNINN